MIFFVSTEMESRKLSRRKEVSGCFPEFGAIFMSNRSTLQECFQKRLLGLPNAQSGFVRRVKAGMTLFLFEFEERKLFGVFEAISDGGMNIDPQAYVSTGKSFPAQVPILCSYFICIIADHIPIDLAHIDLLRCFY